MKYSLIVISTIIGCISISEFAFLVVISITITRPEFGLNICAITTGIKKSINKKNKNKHDKIVLLEKSNLNRIKVLISKALIDSNINNDQFVLMNNALKEFFDMNKEIKNSNIK